MDNKPIQIDIDKVVKSRVRNGKGLPGFMVRYLKRIIHQDEMNAFLKDNYMKRGVDFAEACKEELFRTGCEIHGEENIPSDGKYIFASNHPLGGLDGILLITYLGKRYDKKLKVQVNDLLMNVEPLSPVFLPVNKYGKQSRELIQQTEEVLASDNQILVFPAGLCSRMINGEIKDLEWQKWFITTAVNTRRDIIPIYFDGKNSSFFYRFANLRKKLGIKFNIELIYLPDEMFKAKHKKFGIHIGKPIPWQTFDASKKPKEWAQYVKGIVYKLKTE